MIPIRWEVFRARFPVPTARLEFERMASLMFCQRYGLKHGLFRYKNHPNLETEAVVVGNEVIGFQAKYFDDKVSAHTKELEEAIEGAQARQRAAGRPLTKIVFYLDQDFTGITKGGGDLKAAYEKKLLSVAAQNGVEIEWMAAGEIEIELAQLEYQYIAEYYFAESQGLIDLIRVLDERTFANLSRIRTKFCVSVPPVDRSSELRTLAAMADGQVLVVEGVGGVGKSAVVKQYLCGLKPVDGPRRQVDVYFLTVEDAVGLLVSRELRATWKTSLKSFLSVHADVPVRVLVIDSAEHLEGSSRLNEIVDVIREFSASGWRVICTTRPFFALPLGDVLKEAGLTVGLRLNVRTLEQHQVDDVLSSYGVPSGVWASLRDALSVPLYLDLYLRMALQGDGSSCATISAWKDCLWRRLIQGGVATSSRGRTFLKLVERKRRSGVECYREDNLSSEDIRGLIQDGILFEGVRDGRLYIAHDVYEEWALVRIVQQMHDVNPSGFPACLGSALAMRRAFRLWLYERLNDGEDAVDDIIGNVLISNSAEFRIEVVLALMQNVRCGGYLARQKSFLLENDNAMLTQFLGTALLVARERRQEWTSLGLSVRQDHPYSCYLTRPAGCGWKSVIEFLEGLTDEQLRSAGRIILRVLRFLSESDGKGPLARQIGLIALRLADNDSGVEPGYSLLRRERVSFVKDVWTVLIATASEIREELGRYIAALVEERSPASVYNVLVEMILSDALSVTNLIIALPKLVERIFSKCVWRREDRDIFRRMRLGCDKLIGLNDNVQWHACGESAWRTPYMVLLTADSELALRSIIAFTNEFIDRYVESEYETLTTISFHFPDGTESQAFGSLALWASHRRYFGPVLPSVLSCVMMALEKYLVDSLVKGEKTRVVEQCLMLLRESRCASVAGVVTSAVLSNPADCFEVARVLMSSRAAFDFDLRRSIQESRPNIGSFFGPDASARLYAAEREEANKAEWRKTSLEYIAVIYQVVHVDNEEEHKRAEIVHRIIDEQLFVGKLRPVDECFRRRIDLRLMDHWEPVAGEDGQVAGFRPVPKTNPVVEKLQRENAQASRTTVLACKLSNWAHASVADKKEDDSAPADQYGMRPELALQDLRELLETSYGKPDDLIGNMAVPQAAAVLLSFHHEILGEDDRRDLYGIVVKCFERHLTGSILMSAAGFEGVVYRCLPLLWSDAPEAFRQEVLRLILFALLDNTQENFHATILFDIIRTAECLSDGIRLCWAKRLILLQAQYHSWCVQNPNRNFMVSSLGLFLKARLPQVELILGSDGSAETKWAQVTGKELAAGMRLINPLSQDVDTRRFVAENAFVVLDSAHEDEYGEFRPFVRLYVPWLLELPVGERDSAIRKLDQIGGLFNSSYVLEAMGVYAANHPGVGENLCAYWASFCPRIIQCARHRGNVLAGYVFATDSFGWNSKPLAFIDEKMVGLVLKVFAEIPSTCENLSYFVIFFSTTGAAHWKRGLAELSSATARIIENGHIGRECHELVSCLEFFALKLLAGHRSEILKSNEMTGQLVRLLDYMVLHDSYVAFQMRETL